MKMILVGLWAVAVTLGAAYGVAAWKMETPGDEEGPRLEGLRYTALPTMSVPVVDAGRISGYVVVRMVYTADTAVLRSLAMAPDAFITDEIFRDVYGRAETRFGQLRRMDLTTLAEEARKRANARLGDEVIKDLLVDGLNYIDLSDPSAAQAAAQFTGNAILEEQTPAARVAEARAEDAPQ
ncbi:MAG: hypothetical protein ROR55_07795 [Devosia sp.]